MQTLVGPLINVAGSLVGGVTFTEGDQVPSEAGVWLLDQLEHEPVRRLRSALLAERNIELATTWQFGSVWAVRLAALPVELCAGFDCPTSALCLRSCGRARTVALNLLFPLERA